jgi:hypothetical protein
MLGVESYRVLSARARWVMKACPATLVWDQCQL